MDREFIISEIQRVVSESGTDTVSRSTFKSKSNISEWQILKHFDSWSEAVEAAGFVPIDNKRIDDDTLFQEMRSVFIQNGGICNRTQFDKQCQYCVDVYKKHFGKWTDILIAFREWLGTSEDSFPFIDQLPRPAVPNDQRPVEESTSRLPYHQTASKGTLYGHFLNFRGLQHEPINEQGVVFLFGTVCFELGFAVEAIQTGFPDCEAKRRVKNRRGEWQKVRIEFEYRSSEFRNHGHNPEGCDVIVCWIHDWQECPLEVLELRTAIKELEE